MFHSDFLIMATIFEFSYCFLGYRTGKLILFSYPFLFFEIVREKSIILTFELCYRFFESSYWFFTLSYQFLNSHTDFLNSHTDFWILMNVVLKERLGKWNKPMFVKVFETKVKAVDFKDSYKKFSYTFCEEIFHCLVFFFFRL